MAAKASGVSSKTPKIATIFISAHSVEDPQHVIALPENIEIRMLNSQKVCGRHNFESPDSIRNKLDYWTDVFKHRYGTPATKKRAATQTQSTFNVMEHGISEFNKLIVPRTSIASTWRPIVPKGEKYDDPFVKININQISYYNRILKRLKDIVISGEDLPYFIHILNELDTDDSVVMDIVELIKKETDSTKFMQIILGYNPKLFAHNLNYVIGTWKQHVLDDFEDEKTNVSSIDPVLHEKEYVFIPNPEETTDDILGSFYGIHLIQNSEEEDAIHLYRDDEHITNDNLISGDYTFKIRNMDDPDGEKRKFTITSSRKKRDYTPFMLRAIEYFTPLINMKRDKKYYKNTVTLSEIITFFQRERYNVLNIIDTGCRNVDAKKTELWDNITYIEKMLAITTKKHRKLSSLPFNPDLGKKRRSKRRYKHVI